MCSRKVDVRLPGKGGFNLPWREAGPPNHHDDKVDAGQQVVNHRRPFVGASQARSWSPWLVLGAILWALIAKS